MRKLKESKLPRPQRLNGLGWCLASSDYLPEKCKEENRMTYGDLDLAKIREEADLDFAHYTYLPNQCSCCFSPRQQPAKYWKNGKISDKWDIQYILFKNAANGSGWVTAKNYLAEQQEICIEWHLTPDRLNKVIRLLREQVGKEFIVSKPENDMWCIKLKRRSKMKEVN